MKKRLMAIFSTVSLFVAACGVMLSILVPLSIPGNDPHKILSGGSLGIPGNDPHNWINDTGPGLISEASYWAIPGNDPHNWQPLLEIQVLGIPGNDPH